MEPLTVMLEFFELFISLRIAKRKEDFPLPMSPNIMINFPFSMVRLTLLMAVIMLDLGVVGLESSAVSSRRESLSFLMLSIDF